jgi:hypothetical protein
LRGDAGIAALFFFSTMNASKLRRTDGEGGIARQTAPLEQIERQNKLAVEIHGATCRMAGESRKARY